MYTAYLLFIYNLSFNNFVNVNTDTIPVGNSNKFIENNIYKNNLTIIGDLIYNNSIIKGDITPFTDNQYKIGNSSAYFNNIYSSKFTIGSSANNSNLTIDFNNNNLNFVTNSKSLFFINSNADIYTNGDLFIRNINISNLIYNNSKPQFRF